MKRKLLFIGATILTVVSLCFIGCSSDDNDSNNNNTASHSNDSKGEEDSTSYIGSIKPNEAKKVGDIIFSDGSAISYSAELTLTEKQKSNAIAVVFYVPTGTGEPTLHSNVNILGKKTLGVGIYNTQSETSKTLNWASYSSSGYTKGFTDIQCYKNENRFIEPYYSTGLSTAPYIYGDYDGQDNWDFICAQDITADMNASTNYPAFNWVNNYAKSHSITNEYAKDWYMPTLVELRIIYDKLLIINTVLEAIGGTKIEDSSYWSSTQSSSSTYKAWEVDFTTVSKGFIYEADKSTAYSVCAIRAF